MWRASRSAKRASDASPSWSPASVSTVEAVRRVEARRTGPITKWIYLRAACEAFAHYRAPRLSLSIDGEDVPGTHGWVLVANVIGYGGIWKLDRARKLDDGLFEVYSFPARTRRALLGYGLRGATRGFPSGDCRMWRARHVRVEAQHETAVEIDGDAGGGTPVELEVEHAPFRLLVP